MKILHVVPSFGLGGMEKVVCSVINALPNFVEQEVLVLSQNTEASIWMHHPGVRLMKMDKPEGRFDYFIRLFEVLKHSKPSVLMTYNWGATDAIWLGRLVGIPNVLHSEHGFNAEESASTSWKRNVIRFLVYRLTRLNIVVSKNLVRMMVRSFRLSQSKVVFIPNGIKADTLVADFQERMKVRQSLQIDAHDILIGFSGRLDPVKNLNFLLEVFHECAKLEPRFRLILVGDGPERFGIEERCRLWNLGNKVKILGQKTSVLPYLRALDVFMLTSSREQMPMSMLEAMSVGVPVVASSVGEIPCILQHQNAGIYCDLSDGVRPFVEGLLVLANDSVREEMGKNARTLVVEKFQERGMVEKYLSLLSRVLEKDLFVNQEIGV